MLRARGLTGTFFLSQDACQALDVLNVHKTHFLLARLGAAAFGREVLAEGAVRHAPSNGSQVFGAEQWEIPDERAIKHLLNYDLPLDVATDVLDRLFRRHIGAPEAFARTLYLDAAKVRTMSAGGMTFGYHTRSHQMLSRLDVSRQREELEAGVTWVRELTGQRRCRSVIRGAARVLTPPTPSICSGASATRWPSARCGAAPTPPRTDDSRCRGSTPAISRPTPAVKPMRRRVLRDQEA